jgi:hypothetical protein
MERLNSLATAISPGAINDILPQERALSNSSAPLKEWLPLAKNKKSWLSYTSIDEYFESCRRPEEQSDDESEEDEDEHTTSTSRLVPWGGDSRLLTLT